MRNGNVLNGRLGQVLGPFDAGSDLLGDDGAISAFTPETTAPVLVKLGIQAAVGTKMLINDVEVKMGKTGIYELEDTVAVKHLIFPDGADEDTIVDFIY